MATMSLIKLIFYFKEAYAICNIDIIVAVRCRGNRILGRHFRFRRTDRRARATDALRTTIRRDNISVSGLVVVAAFRSISTSVTGMTPEVVVTAVGDKTGS